MLEYLLVLDFEATSLDSAGWVIMSKLIWANIIRVSEKPCYFRTSIEQYEIIEFPVVAVDVTSLQVHSQDTFHKYVQPFNMVTEFYTNLTGITPCMLENQPKLSEVLALLEKWMCERGFTTSNSMFVTCGDWDLDRMLPSECRRLGLKYSKCLQQWINIKELFLYLNGEQRSGKRKRKKPDMKEMLNILGLELDGRHHSGIDDCYNIAKILVHLLQTVPNLADRRTLLLKFCKKLLPSWHKKPLKLFIDL